MSILCIVTLLTLSDATRLTTSGSKANLATLPPLKGETMNLSATTLIGDSVKNSQGENLGDLKEIMLDTTSGKVSYAVLDFGGFLGVGNKLFAVPWAALDVDTSDHSLILNIDKETLKNAEGFDQDDWPNFSDRDFERRVHDTYSATPYWE